MEKTTDRHIGFQAAGNGGLVAAGGAAAVAAGVTVLEAGGNAADAAVATLLALMVSDHGPCSIGGESPLMIYDAERRAVKVLCGQGRAPRSEEAVRWYMEHGVPAEGDIKTAPVPSVVDLCTTTLVHYGTKSFEELVAPALALLDTGNEAWHPKLATTVRRMIDSERAAGGSRRRRLQAVSDRFYGRPPEADDVAGELEDYYRRMGGFLRKADLAAHRTTVEEPVSVVYRGYTVCKCGPWTQGPVLCQALRLLESFDLRSMGRLSADYVHLVVEALKLAMADRDAYYGDPDFTGVPLDALLSEEYARLRRPLLSMDRASAEIRPGDPYGMGPLASGGVFHPGVGGTTTCVVADRWGNLVSATPSANVPREPRDGGQAGVTFGNRLRSFNTTAGHPNCIAAGKRPRITLTPTLVLKDGAPVAAISVAGGDLQEQVTLSILLDYVEFGILPAEAVTAPRFATMQHEDSFDPRPDRRRAIKGAGRLQLSGAFGAELREELGGRGHHIDVQTKPIGYPVMLAFDAGRGVWEAAGDPATGRHAAGVEA